MDEPIIDETLHNLVYNLRMCMKEDNFGLKNIKRDHSRGINICPGQGYPFCFDSLF